MTQHGDDTTRRVVKKVVKKTVERPDPSPAQAAQPWTRLRGLTRAKLSALSRPRLPSLPRPDVRGRAIDLRYAITDRLQDAAEYVSDTVSEGWRRLGLRLSQMSSVQVVAAVGFLLLVLALAYGWGVYLAFHPWNGNR